MPTAKPARRTAPRAARAPVVPLQTGQVWHLCEANLEVGMIGKLLVHYKFAKPNAVRTPTSVASIKTLEKFMRKNKAVLVKK